MYHALLSILFFIYGINSFISETQESELQQETQNIYQFSVHDIKGKVFDFSTLKGKKIMVVNTASKCGLTPQYEDLQSIYEKYNEKGLVIVGFPSNDFLWQEPGSSDEIAAFCKLNYGVTFPMMGKIKVKGSEMHDVYSFLTEKRKNGLKDSKVKWNFQKYLVGSNGEFIDYYLSATAPTSLKITKNL